MAARWIENDPPPPLWKFSEKSSKSDNPIIPYLFKR